MRTRRVWRRDRQFGRRFRFIQGHQGAKPCFDEPRRPCEPPAGRLCNTGKTADCNNAACENSESKLYGVQFHPESAHTDCGRGIIQSFLYDICGASGDYKLDDYINTQIKSIRQKIGNEKILLALSGGVDSSVCAAPLSSVKNWTV